MAPKGDTIREQLKELEAIAAWFEKESDFDVEEGLQKVKEGAVLVKKLKDRIQEVENEFQELKADLSNDEA